jgi:hypothetical protein
VATIKTWILDNRRSNFNWRQSPKESGTHRLEGYISPKYGQTPILTVADNGHINACMGSIVVRLAASYSCRTGKIALMRLPGTWQVSDLS